MDPTDSNLVHPRPYKGVSPNVPPTLPSSLSNPTGFRRLRLTSLLGLCERVGTLLPTEGPVTFSDLNPLTLGSV